MRCAVRQPDACVRPFRRPAAGVGKVFDCILRTALVLSLWHAPIPWLHQHDLPGSGGVPTGGLARHLNEYHGDLALAGQIRLGWHVHLALPWCDAEGGACPDENAPAESGHFDCGLKDGVIASSNDASDNAAPIGWCATVFAHAAPTPAGVAPGQACMADNGAGGHFLATYGSAIASADLFGVRVC